MGPEKEKTESKPVAMPHKKDQTGVSQPNQSLWGEGQGKVIQPPPDAVPGKPEEEKA